MTPRGSILEDLLDRLAPLGPIVPRRMFGGTGLFRHGLMFALIARDELFLKVNDTNRADYEAEGEAPFSYATSKGINTIASYWHCPSGVLDNTDALQAWSRKAIDAALANARAKPARKPRR
jgi:DNA transformation protein